MKSYCILLFLFLSFPLLWGQSQESSVKVDVIPDHADWNYKPGEEVIFTICVTQSGQPVDGVKVRYELSEDMMPTFDKGEIMLTGGTAMIKGGSLQASGFIRCRVWTDVEDKTHRGIATAAFAPENIQPTVAMPQDFKEFWDKAKAANARIPVETRMELLPERCTDKVNVYQVAIQNYREEARVYGILCVPKAPGKYPAILKVPGAGMRPYEGEIENAEQGVITLQIGIHGVPVVYPPHFYKELSVGPLENYPQIKLDDKDNYYYKRVYLGCVRAVDYIFTLDEFDGENICVEGGSQGGALAIVTAALDPRIKGLVSYYPALCDLGGYTHNRAGGWPHLFKDPADPLLTDAKLETMQYYDVVNFARLVSVPGLYIFGYNDMTCPPTSVFSAYNSITAPKETIIVPYMGHVAFTEQREAARTWLFEKLKE